MKKQMKQVAAATLAALCLGTVAIPTVASAATITITTPDVLAGTTAYSVYKVFEVTEKTATNTVQTIVPDSFAAGVEEYFKGIDAVGIGATDDPATIASKIGTYLNGISSNTDAAQNLGRELLMVLKKNNVEHETSSTTTAASVSVDVAKAGYYLVTADATIANGTGTDDDEKVVSAVMLDTSNATMSVTLKADKPTIEKKIVEDDLDATDATTDTDGEDIDLVDANTAGVGENVKYQITSDVPDHSQYAEYTFKMTDTICKGLDIDLDTLVITIGTDKLVKDTGYTVTFTEGGDAGDTLVIDFLTIKNYAKDAAVVVTYEATVNANADVTATGNPNEVYLTYSNNPLWDLDGDGIPNDNDPNPNNPETPDDTPIDPNIPNTPPTEDTPEDQVITYLTTIDVYKVDGNQNPLLPDTLPTGEYIGFTLYNEDGSAAYDITVDPNNSAVNVVAHPANGPASNAENPDLTEFEAQIQKVAGDADGDGTVEDGEYVAMLTFSGLTEGIYKLVETHVPANYVKGADITITIDADFGTVTQQKSRTDAPAWTYKNGTADATTSNDFTVINTQGTNLPSTGGIGTTIFTVVGLTLMATAAGAFIIKRKVTAQ